MSILDVRLESLDAPVKERSNRENKRMMTERFSRVKGRFDSQFTTDENQRHFALADNMSVDASASWMIRRTLRMRCRYEYHNNGYFQGIADTIGNYVIGTGPRLQMLTANKALNAAIEKLYAEWAKEIGLADTLLNMRVARVYNGESFSLLRNNPKLCCPVKLDVFEIEADQVSSPLFGMYPSQYADQFFDGVILDPWGRPEKYHILRQHPGAFGAFVILGYEFDPWPAKYVLHDYKKIRPGQQRGIPEALPALPLFAQLRRFALAVLGAAETAADYAAVIESEAAGDDTMAPEPMDTFNLEARMATVLPSGWKLGQMKAEQPTTTYDMFENAILRQICRTMNMPLFFGSLDARLANMASAYVVTQPFSKSVQKDRAGYERLLDRVLAEFLQEAQFIPGLLPRDIPADGFAHVWRWPRIGQHADPLKTSTAQAARIDSGVSSIPIECAEEGLDWEEVQDGAARSMGMTVDEYQAALRQKAFAIRGQPSPATVTPEDMAKVNAPTEETDPASEPVSEDEE